MEAAETDLAAAEAQVRGQVAQARANRFKLEHAIEDVDNQIANLRAAVATLNSQQGDAASWPKPTETRRGTAAQRRHQQGRPRRAPARRSRWPRRPSSRPCRRSTRSASGLGLPPQPPRGESLADVPPDLDQNFSSVRQALGELLQSAAQLGYFPTSWTATPKEAIEDFYKQDPEGNLDRIYARLIPQAPGRQAGRGQGARRRSATWTRPS